MPKLKDTPAFYSEVFILPKSNNKGTDFPILPASFNGICVISDNNDPERETAQNDLLEKIISSIGKSLESTLICQTSDVPDLAEIFNHTEITHLIIFTDKDFEWNIDQEKYIVKQMGHLKLLFSDNLETLSQNAQLKKDLWFCLKGLFNRD